MYGPYASADGAIRYVQLAVTRLNVHATETKGYASLLKRQVNCSYWLEGNAMRKSNAHEQYCFAGQPAPCAGYFKNDALPCICGANGNVLLALAKTAIPAVPLEQFTPELHLLALSA
jgi:hypothetical protein